MKQLFKIWLPALSLILGLFCLPGRVLADGPDPGLSQKLPGTAAITQESLAFGKGLPEPQVSSETNDSAPIITYKPQSAPEESYSPQVPTAVGSYTAKVIYPETQTHLEAAATADFTIFPLVSGLQLDPAVSLPAMVYNGRLQPVPLPAVLPLSFTVEGTEETPRAGVHYEITASLLRPWVSRDPNDLNLSLSLRFLEGDFVFDPALPQEFSLHGDILKAPLTITALDQATREGFRRDLSAVQAQGLSQGDLLTEISLTENAGALVPSDPRIMREGQDVTDQYDISFRPGLLTHSARITDYPVAAEGLSYNGEALPLLTQEGAAEGGTLVYALSYQASQTGEEIPLSAWSARVPTGKAPGIYHLRFKAQGADLADSEEQAMTLIIAPKVLNLSATASKVYDGTNTLPEENITLEPYEDQIVPGDRVSVKTIEGSVFESLHAGENIGITPGNPVLKGEEAGNYTVKIASFTGTITPKPLSLIPEEAKKAYGTCDPALTYRAEGLVPGDRLTGSLSRQPGEETGSYALTPGSLTEENNPDYAITLIPRTFTIREAQPGLSLNFSKKKARPGKTLTITLESENKEENLLSEGWAQPKAAVLYQGDTPLPLVSLGDGRFEASFSVPKESRGTLSFSATLADKNYRFQEARETLRISRLGNNPLTGDRILFYGSSLAVSVLTLLGIAIYLYVKKRKP